MDILISVVGIVVGLFFGLTIQKTRPIIAAVVFVVVGMHLWIITTEVGDRIFWNEPRSQAPWWEPSDNGVSWQPSGDEVRS